MSKRRGLSFEEKRTKLLEVFHDSKDFFQLKELEKIAPKQKGIVSQSVKEVLESLVSDNLVCAEKIGTSNYFWSFPSAALVSSRLKLDALQEEKEQLEAQKEMLQEKYAEAYVGREESEERTRMLARIKDTEKKLSEQVEELQKYAENDPEIIEAKQEQTEKLKSEINKWTENIFIVQAYCRNRFNIGQEDFNTQFGIPDDFDTIN